MAGMRSTVGMRRTSTLTWPRCSILPARVAGSSLFVPTVVDRRPGREDVDVGAGTPIPGTAALTARAATRSRHPAIPTRTRPRGDRPASTATSSSAVTIASTAAPAKPPTQASRAPGNPAKKLATAAIQAEGTQAIAAITRPSMGATGKATHATNPTTVAIGDAGSARALASTPYSGKEGLSRMRIGWQASCAASGTAIDSESQRGRMRSSCREMGAVSVISPAVAMTESANPMSRASHGSKVSIAIMVRPTTDSPCTGRPPADVARTTAAMTADRSTLGCGVTRTTKPIRTAKAAAIRSPLRMPMALPTSRMRPITTAQLAPETAVRWLRLLVFIAVLSAGLTATVSPMARPGSSSPPSPGSAAAARAKPARRPFAQDRYQGGAAVGRAAVRANTRKDTSSLGGVAIREPLSRTVVPISVLPVGDPPNTSTGTDTDRPLTRVSVAAK